MRRRAGAVLALAGLLGLTFLPGAAATVSDGTWWYHGMGIPEVHAQGATGAGVTVAVIDDGINPDLPVFEGADLQVHEPSFCVGDTDALAPAARSEPEFAWHGTNVAAHVVGSGRGTDGGPSVAGVAPDARLLFYAIGDGTTSGKQAGDVVCLEDTSDGSVDAPATAQALRQAVDDGAEIVSISVGGAYRFSEEVREAVAWAMHEGVIVVAGLGEYQSHRVNPVPDDLAALLGVVAVEACDPDLVPIEGEPGSGKPMPHDRVTVCAPGKWLLVQGDREASTWDGTTLAGGTSLAAPVTAGALAAVWSAYPDATANQILQSLVLNTGAEDHALGYDPVYGYGVLGLRHMLREDPRALPDENPLLAEPVADPSVPNISAEQVANATRPVWPGDPEDAASPSPVASEPTPAAAPQDPVAPQPAGVPVWTWGVVGAVLALGALLAVVLVRRRTASPPPTP